MFDELKPWKAFLFLAVIVAGAVLSYTISAKIKSSRDSARSIDNMRDVVSALDRSLAPAPTLDKNSPPDPPRHFSQAKYAYRWIDKTGQWHLSDSPPAGVSAEAIPVQPLTSPPGR